MEFNLEGRTKKLSKDLLVFIKKVKINDLNKNIILQLLRSGTSVGANYCEAINASSKKDFINKIYICRKEIQETRYWVELLATIEEEFIENLRLLWKESHELTLIFNKISKSAKNNN